jgi:hypothetical protein
MSDPPKPEGQRLAFAELENPDGGPPRMVEVVDFDVRPLGFDALLNAPIHRSFIFPIEIANARIVKTDILNLDASKPARLSAQIETSHSSRVIALVPGGWLPSGLAISRKNATLFIDRNIVGEIVGRFDGGVNKGREPDFLDVFANQVVRVNPMLCVLEGNTRSPPSVDEVGAQLQEVTAQIRKALPTAILPDEPNVFRGVVGLIEDSRAGMAQREAFLLRVAPVLRSPVSRSRIDERWNDVLVAADACGVRRKSLVVLAALSCIVAPKGPNLCRRLLKFRPSYRPADAYNALADLRALDIFINLCALWPEHLPRLCTADKDLALFWTGLRVTNIAAKRGGATFDLSPVEALLPAKYATRWLCDAYV